MVNEANENDHPLQILSRKNFSNQFSYKTKTFQSKLLNLCMTRIRFLDTHLRQYNYGKIAIFQDDDVILSEWKQNNLNLKEQ